MTKKDFVAFADAIRELQAEVPAEDRAAVGWTVTALVPALKRANRAFSADKFVTAAGFPGLANFGY